MIMNKLFNLRSLIGIVCISSAIFLRLNGNIINNDVDLIIPTPPASIVPHVKPIASLITNDLDRKKLAIFNKEFSSRVTQYNCDVQQLNDVYVLAASYFFEDSINNKYENLDEQLINLIKSITTEDNHSLTTEEKSKLSEYFLGLSWVLIN